MISYRSHSYLLFCIILLLSALECILKSEIEGFLFHFGKEIHASYKDIHVLSTFSSLGIDRCVKKCLKRDRCRFINYLPRFKMCYLIAQLNYFTDWRGHVAKKPGIVLVVIDELIKKGGIFQIEPNAFKRNVNKDCGPHKKTLYRATKGNMFNDGNKAIFKCNKRSGEFVTLKCERGIWESVSHGLIPEACYRDCEVWTHNKSSCYAYINDEKKTMYDGNKHCLSMNGYLIHIESQEEQDLIQRMLVRYGENDLVYIGLSDEETEGVFKWIGETTPAKFGHWRIGEPSGRTVENCVVICPYCKYYWADYFCDRELSYICEIELNYH